MVDRKINAEYFSVKYNHLKIHNNWCNNVLGEYEKDILVFLHLLAIYHYENITER